MSIQQAIRIPMKKLLPNSYLTIAWLLSIGLVLTGILPTYANNGTDTLFSKAFEAQSKGKHATAIQYYEQILAQDQAAVNLYNNLALAYINNQELGKGIVQLERALRLSPNNPIALQHLQAAQQKIETPIPAIQSLFFIRWWRALAASFSNTTWAIIGLLICWIGAALWGRSWWLASDTKKWRTIAFVLFAISGLCFALGNHQRAQLLDQQVAIVIKKEIGLRAAPNLSSDEIAYASEGIKVRILETQEQWAQVELPNKLLGWVPLEFVERV